MEKLGAKVMGASFDEPSVNRQWAEDLGVAFPLLSDVTQEVGRAYGVDRPIDDPQHGKPRRVTFLIDPAGTIAAVYEVADIAGHSAHVLADLERLTLSYEGGGI
jgi:peroxiredoxin Q/BCP